MEMNLISMPIEQAKDVVADMYLHIAKAKAKVKEKANWAREEAVAMETRHAMHVIRKTITGGLVLSSLNRYDRIGLLHNNMSNSIANAPRSWPMPLQIIDADI